jgi:hypothetical protein
MKQSTTSLAFLRPNVPNIHVQYMSAMVGNAMHFHEKVTAGDSKKVVEWLVHRRVMTVKDVVLKRCREDLYFWNMRVVH